MDDYNQNKTVIELSTDSPINNSYFYSVLELPATPVPLMMNRHRTI